MKILKNFFKNFYFIFFIFSLTGCNSTDKNVETLNIYNWGDYINPDVITQFTKETGIKVNSDYFDSNEIMYAKISMTGASYDLLFPSDYMITKLINENMLQEINFNNIPNFKYIRKSLQTSTFDSNDKYHVPYMWGTLGILYNKTMVKTPVDSWDILWDTNYKNQIIMYESERDSMAAALKKLGYSLNTTNPKEIDEAKNLLIEQKPLVQAYLGDPMKDKMIGNDAALALIYSGDALYCIQSNPNLDYAIPKEGSNAWVDGIVIPKNAKNKAAAEKFINFLCRPDIAALNSQYIGYATAVEAALKDIDPSLSKNPIFWPSDDILKKQEYFIDVGKDMQLYSDAWTEVLSK